MQLSARSHRWAWRLDPSLHLEIPLGFVRDMRRILEPGHPMLLQVRPPLSAGYQPDVSAHVFVWVSRWLGQLITQDTTDRQHTHWVSASRQ